MPMAACLSVLLAAAPGVSAEEWSPRLTEVTGDVLIYAADSEEGLPAEAGTPLEDGDRVETADDGRAELAMEADSVVELGPKTSFTMGSTQKEDSWFSVNLGSFLAKLQSMAESRRRFVVRTPTAVCAVRGTEFGVEVGDDGDTTVGVFDEGTVGVSAVDEDGAEETVLTSQSELELKPGERPGRPRALKRLKARRERMGRIRGRRAELRRVWKDLPPERRRELRQGLRERLKNMPPEKRERLMKGFKERRGKLHERREGLRQRRQNKGPENRERLKGKLEERQGSRAGRKGPGGGDQRRKGPPPRGRRR